jgi:hypothetical protein
MVGKFEELYEIPKANLKIGWNFFITFIPF